MNKKIFIGLALAAIVVVAGSFFFMQNPSNQPQIEPAPPTPRESATGPEEKGGFALAFSGLGDTEGGDSTGCAQDSICLQGRFAPELPVRVLLSNSSTCTARTGDAFHINADEYDFDATVLTGLEGCATSDLGRDSTIAIVETEALLDAFFKWLPVEETGKDVLATLEKSADAKSILQAYAKSGLPDGKATAMEMKAGPLSLVSVRWERSQSEESTSLGPVFALTGNKPQLLPPPDELCSKIDGAFELGTSLFVQISGAPCASDTLSTRLLEWTGKEWKQVLDTTALDL